MNRRHFIKQTAAATALVGATGLTSAFAKTRKLTVLHTNDVHSYVDPFPITHPKYPNRGGVARRAAMIEQIRSTENVLLLDAGDIFQGTPYFNYYGGELEFKLMSMMGYDLATLGNHDFDNGIEGFHAMLPHAQFGFVSANYDFSNTVLSGLVPPYRIFDKGGIIVGVFGLGVELAGLVDKKLYKETRYLDPVGIAQDMARKLKFEKRCDIVICLSHLGYQYKNDPEKISDVKLAGLTSDIDLIIGGHTHTFLDKPTIAKNRDGKDVLINQTGCYGVNMGRIDFILETRASSGRTIVV